MRVVSTLSATGVHMTTTIGIYFLGQYRPAYFEGGNTSIAMQKALNAVAMTDDASWLSERIRNCAWELRKPNTESNNTVWITKQAMGKSPTHHIEIPRNI